MLLQKLRSGGRKEGKRGVWGRKDGYFLRTVSIKYMKSVHFIIKDFEKKRNATLTDLHTPAKLFFVSVECSKTEMTYR